MRTRPICLLIAVLAAAGVSIDSPAMAAAPETISGWVAIRWIEDFSNPGSTVFQYLLVDDAADETVMTFADGLAPSAREGQALSGQFVTITGERLQDGTVEVQSNWRDHVGVTERTGLSVSGARPYVSIMCRFMDSSTFEPHPPEFYAPITDNSYPHLDHFWRAQSYGLVTLAGSASAPAWVTLPRPRSYYITNETVPTGNLYGPLIQDCAAAADASIFFPSYVGINMFFNRGLGCCSVGGSQTITVDGQTSSFAYTLMNPDHVNQLAVLAHEIGHTLGFPHSSGQYEQIYDSQWDVMSSPGGRCFLSDPSFRCVPQHTIAFHKDLGGWIPSGRKFVASRGTRTTITVAETTGKDSTGYLLAVIPIGATAKFYTVETRRVTDQYDMNAPGDAVLIHIVDTTAMLKGDLNTPAATVIDPDGNGNPNDAGAMWTSGETFQDGGNGITISVTATTATAATVVITTYQLFTDDVLTPGLSILRAVHVNELRTRIDALRARVGLVFFGWTDPTLSAGATPIKAQHIVDLRTALAQAYGIAGRTPPTYTDPGLGPGVTMKVAHIAELRAAVIAME